MLQTNKQIIFCSATISQRAVFQLHCTGRIILWLRVCIVLACARTQNCFHTCTQSFWGAFLTSGRRLQIFWGAFLTSGGMATEFFLSWCLASHHLSFPQAGIKPTNGPTAFIVISQIVSKPCQFLRQTKINLMKDVSRSILRGFKNGLSVRGGGTTRRGYLSESLHPLSFLAPAVFLALGQPRGLYFGPS